MRERIPKSAVALLVVLLAGGAGALSSGSATGQDHHDADAGVVAPLRADASSARFAGSARSEKGAERTLRVFNTEDSRICLQVGERRGDDLGQSGPRGFARMPLEAAVCGSGMPFVTTTRDVLEPTKGEASSAVTTVYGLVPVGATDVTLQTSAGVSKVPVSTQRTFVLTFDGRLLGAEPKLSWREADGTTRSIGGRHRVDASGLVPDAR